MTTAEELRAYTRAPERDRPYLESLVTTAGAMVARLIGTAEIPDEVRKQAQLLTAANLYQRRTTQTELGGWENGLPQPVPGRPSLDPLLHARQILGPFLGPGIA